MLRKWYAIAAFLMVCLPIGGGAHFAMATYADHVNLPGLVGHCWFAPNQLVAICGCLLALCLLAGQRRS